MDVNFKLADYEDIEALVQLCNEVFLEDTKVEDAKKNFFILNIMIMCSI